jgi:multidrug efflux pump subunit AcrB
MRSLPRFSADQTVFVNVLFFVCLLAGYGAYTRIPVEFFPDVNLNQAVISTVWTGASAEEVERLVTQKLEEELLGVSDIDKMHSVSRANLSSISLDFDEYLDEVGYEAAVNDVRAAIERASDLPADAEDPHISEVKMSEFQPAVLVAVIDAGGVGRASLREVARDAASRMRDLPGARRIEVRGEREREIRVLVDRDAAARYAITVAEVAARIRQQNMNLPAGTFETESGEFTLRAQGDFQSLDEIRQTVVAETATGGVVRVAEVARVEAGLEKAAYATRYNGHPALIVAVMKRSDSDTRELVAAVDEWIDAYRARLPHGVEMEKTLDTSEFIASHMDILIGNLVAGVFFVMGILWFTIGFRNAVLTVIAIPFSFLTAMILFPVIGITINSNTIIGLVLVSGMLVDDAIIVLENIYRRIEEGEELRDAVINGAEEVLWPVVAAVATTCAAFAPLLLVGGTVGKFMEILPKAVIVCLVASLFECLIILPAHYLDFGSRQGAGKNQKQQVPRQSIGGFATRVFAPVASLAARIRERVDAGLVGLRDRYAWLLDVVLENGGSFALLFVSLLFFANAVAGTLRVELFPGEFNTFNVLLETPSDSDLDFTDRIVAGYEEVIGESLGRDIRDYSTTVGMSEDTNYDRLHGPYYALSTLTIVPSDENVKAPEKVLFRIQEQVERWRQENPDGILELRVQAAQDGPPVGTPVDVRLHGDDYALGKAVAGELVAYLRSIPGVYNVEDNLKLGAPEVQLRVNPERAARHGLTFEDIALALRSANDGIVASSYREPSRNDDADIRVMLAAQYRGGIGSLLDVELTTKEGYLVKLRDVADVDVRRGYRAFHRYDAKRTVSVLAQVDGELATSRSVNEQLQAHFADLAERFPQLEVRYGGEFSESTEAFANLFAVFPAAMVAIYMILAALFRSYLQPLVVITAVPFGFAGIIAGVAIFDYSITFFLMYAAVGLTGVVVNDSLVMVDFINRARAKGMGLNEAVRQSGVRRFRPILLTTLTTVCALLPMAFGMQGESKSYGPFAAAISFGLIVAMIGTLFVVPLSYAALARLAERTGGLRRSQPLADEAAR